MAQFGTVSKGSVGNTKTSRIRSRSWFFTYNNYKKIDITNLVAQFTDSFCEYVFQEEIGDNQTIHLQGVIRFKNPIGIAFQKNYPIEIHWERCRSWPQAVKYCTKRDTRNGDILTNIKNLKIRPTIVDPLKGKTLHKFQSDILIIISTSPDNRKIYWYYEPIGCSGKTSLAKHLVLKHKAIVVGGRLKDAQYAITELVKSRDPKIVIFDIPRSQLNHVSYAAIESIKNGLFFNSKYESGMCIFNIPHVIVFANSSPCIGELSLDRWIIKRI